MQICGKKVFGFAFAIAVAFVFALAKGQEPRAKSSPFNYQLTNPGSPVPGSPNMRRFCAFWGGSARAFGFARDGVEVTQLPTLLTPSSFCSVSICGEKILPLLLGLLFNFGTFGPGLREQFWQPVPACRGWSCSRPFAFIRGPRVFLSVLVLVFLLLPVAYCLLPAFLPCCLLPVACCLDEI